MKRLLILYFLIFILLFYSCDDFDIDTNSDSFFHVKVEGTELPVLVRGNTKSNKFILFINGGPGLTSIDIASLDMFNWSENLEKEFALVYYDQRGCGNVQGNIDEETINILQYVIDLENIISVLKYNYKNAKIFLMGHSFGALIGLRYLLTKKNENQIAGYISISGAYNFDYDLQWIYRRQMLIDIAKEEIANSNEVNYWQEALNWTESNLVLSTSEMRNQWRKYIGWPGEIIIPEEISDLSVRQYLKIGFASSYNPFPSYLSRNLNIVSDLLNDEVDGISFISSSSSLKLPVLFLWGRYDDLIPPKLGVDVYNNFATDSLNKYFKLFPNSSHEPFISDPENFKIEVTDFVKKY